jgi:DNA-binding beta-propeller fold protein YncE
MPHGIVSDKNGNLYVADMRNNSIVKIVDDKKAEIINIR